MSPLNMKVTPLANGLAAVQVRDDDGRVVYLDTGDIQAQERRLAIAKDISRSTGHAEPDIADKLLQIAATAKETPTAQPWPVPLLFGEDHGPPFPKDTLPGPLSAYAEAVADAYQVPLDLPACLILGAAATCGAGKCTVRIREDWREPLNEYYVIALPSGERKSPVFREIVAPIEAWEVALARQARSTIAEEEARRDILEGRLRNAKSEAARHPVSEDTSQALSLAKELAEFRSPVSPLLLADDATPEAVAGLLADHDGRMAIWSTEGGIFEIVAGRYSDGVANTDVFLKSYSGDPVRVDRRGRPAEHIPHPALTLVLTPQPAVIADLARRKEFRGRGFLARVSFALPLSLVGYRSSTPPSIPSESRKRWERCVAGLLGLSGPSEGGEHAIQLSAEASRRFQAFREDVEKRLRPGAELFDIQDWGNKLPGKVARTAGHLHLLEQAQALQPSTRPWEVPLPEAAMEAAIRIGEYLAAHALVAFSRMGADTAVEDAKHVWAWMERKEAETFAKQDIWQGTRGRFKRVGPLDAALAILEERGYIRARMSEARGRGRMAAPSYDVNPTIPRIPAIGSERRIPGIVGNVGSDGPESSSTGTAWRNSL